MYHTFLTKIIENHKGVRMLGKLPLTYAVADIGSKLKWLVPSIGTDWELLGVTKDGYMFGISLERLKEYGSIHRWLAIMDSPGQVIPGG